MVTHDNITRFATALPLDDTAMATEQIATYAVQNEAGFDPGAGHTVYLHIFVDTAVDAGATSVTFIVRTATVAGISALTGGIEVARRTIPDTALTIGSNHYIPLGPQYGGLIGQPVLGVAMAKASGATIAAGAVTMDLTLDTGTQSAKYPLGYTATLA